MKSLFKFLFTYHFFILFLLLETLSVFLLIQYNVYQRAVFINAANSVRGNVYNIFHSVTQYLSLREANEQLVLENTYLRNNLKSSLYDNRVQSFHVNDTCFSQHYIYIPAQIINNSVSKQNNYITLNRGSRQGIRPDMGVICPSGVVGVVRNVSENFSLVISVLNCSLNKYSAKVERSGYFGSLSWNGRNYRFASLSEIPYHVNIHKGDTIVTTGYSVSFPEGIILGTIENFSAGEGDSFYDITVRLSTDFKALNYVYVISNLMKDEQKKIEREVSND
jgi:rod shape-determining protein MreC